MAFDFPNSPTVGQYVTGSGGIVYVWDGVKWTAAPMASPTAPPASTLPIVDGVAAVGTSLAYARADHVHPAIPDVGRNLIHNPLFNVAQRGYGPWTVSGYTADRWQLQNNGNTVSTTVTALTDLIRASIGDEAAEFALQAVVTGVAGAGNASLFDHPIEDVRRLAGKTVTISFWAWASAARNVGVSWDQWFGAGGSPSPVVKGTGQVIAITTTPTRYVATFALPSVSGKTVGSSGGDCTEILFTFSTGATNAAWYGNTGVQSGTFAIWGVQLEIGSVATPLEKPDPRYDLANCQRFFQIIPFGMSAYGTAGVGYTITGPIGTTMRAAPTFTPTYTNQTNCGSSAINAQGVGGFQTYTVVTAAGGFILQGTCTASADL